MAHPARFDPDKLAGAANDFFHVRRVFGEAYERDGVSVIPVARVWAATGMGQGDGEGGGDLPPGPDVGSWWREAHRTWRATRGSHGWIESDEPAPDVAPENAPEPDEHATDGGTDQGADQGTRTGAGGGYGDGHGGGGGYGARIKPVGVYVVDATGVHWHPTVDVNRIVLGAQVVGATAVTAVAGLLAVKAVAAAVSSSVGAFARR